MNIEEIRQLAADLALAGLSGAEVEKPGFKLSLKRGLTGQLSPSSASLETTETGQDSNTLTIKSSGIGRLLDAHPDNGIVLAPPGSEVQVGQLVALLAVGNLILPVRSLHAGKVSSLLVPPGTTVGYGQPLISLGHTEAEQP
ncbi:biotin/lipoyl-containing protein [Pseudomonas lijiangensis]|uniref:acetyl-CoA carboxylase biotin carboxyl carrier protein n=1 Tax=Pseudomonas lijiangensis TaxID=2995658 RepID=UPI0031BB06B3